MTNISPEARDVLTRAVAGEVFYAEPYLVAELVQAGLMVVSGGSWQRRYEVTDQGREEAIADGLRRAD